MKKQRKNFIGPIITALFFVYAAVIIFLALVPVSFDDGLYDEFEVDNGYEITKADYVINVSSNHTAEVTETLTIKYYAGSRGISRYLPTNSGEQYNNITVEGDVYFVESDINFIIVNTGNDHIRFYNGDEQTYVIKYKIVPPVRTIGNSNYYMNIVPFGWTTSQSNVTVSMRFPYEIEDILLYAGRYGTAQTTEVYTLNDDRTAFYMEIDRLAPFSGVTVDAEMGRTFSVNFSLAGFLAIVITLALIGTCICIKLFVVKDNPVFPVVNATPPRDGGAELDPAQMGYLIDNNCEPSDMTAMIFYFASKGLISIESMAGDNIKLTKTGELDSSAPQHQQLLFGGLFKRGNTVTTSQLQNKYYNNITLATANLKGDYAGKLHDKKAVSKSILTAVVSGIVAILIVALMAIRVSLSIAFGGLLFPFAIMALLIFGGFAVGRFAYNYKHKLSQRKLFAICIGAALIAMVVSFIIACFVFGGIFPFYGRVIMLFGLALIGFVCGLINRKTDYYVSLMNEITGFKNFLETAEKERLEAMIDENPQYYYDILPYANVLGVSDKWEEKFKTLQNVPPPSYYHGPNLVDFIVINAMFRKSYRNFTTAMISRPSSSSHSGHGGFGGGHGGGRGGGGFGGGGGGRR